MSTPLLTTAAIRTLEQRWLDRTPDGALMDRAALAVADCSERLLRTLPRGSPVHVLVGPGNNGGDALLAGLELERRGYRVSAYALASPSSAPADAARAWRAWLADHPPPAPLATFAESVPPGGLVIDGLFGIGLSRPLQGDAARVASLLAPGRVRPLPARTGTAHDVDVRSPLVVAIDVPSGLDADTGSVVGGRDGAAIAASTTVTMIADKPGLHTGAGLDFAGVVRVAPLLIDRAEVAAAGAGAQLFEDSDAARLWRPRRRDSHKGSYGSVLVAGGGSGMTGAALLAARGAQCCGAGKIHIATPHGLVFDPGQPQWMSRHWAHPLDGIDAAVIGCGMGGGNDALAELGRLIASPLPLVVDADALTLISADRTLAQAASQRAAPTVYTPHPLEAARLLGIATVAVQADRLGAARELEARFRGTVVLKGAGSIVHEGHDAFVLAAGSPALATAGTGDVLAGMIGALLAQGRSSIDATLAACWAHAAGGQLWERSHPLAIGLSATELPALARTAVNTWGIST